MLLNLKGKPGVFRNLDPTRFGFVVIEDFIDKLFIREYAELDLVDRDMEEWIRPVALHKAQHQSASQRYEDGNSLAMRRELRPEDHAANNAMHAFLKSGSRDTDELQSRIQDGRRCLRHRVAGIRYTGQLCANELVASRRQWAADDSSDKEVFGRLTCKP